jgi:hypothetical protein
MAANIFAMANNVKAEAAVAIDVAQAQQGTGRRRRA